ncbi:MAG: hypothetical protein R3Y09_13170 [Clostridia bacterium]
MINNFEKEILQWLYPCEYFKNLYFAVADLTGEQANGDVIVSPDVMGVDDIYIKRYIHNQGIKRYTVNVAQVNVLYGLKSSPTGETKNVEILDETKKLQMWVQEQIKAKHLPSIGYDIKTIETTGVNVASIDENKNSKVQFQIIIDYYYRGE